MISLTPNSIQKMSPIMEAMLEQDDESATGSLHSIEIAYHSFPSLSPSTPSSPERKSSCPFKLSFQSSSSSPTPSDSDYSQLSEEPAAAQAESREARLRALLQREQEVDGMLCTMITLFVTAVVAAILICVPPNQ